MSINNLNLNTQMVEGFIPGLIMPPLPPAFAIVVGILFGIVAFLILDESKKVR
jgi:hypothetical protein